jgi:hypothetical protein
MCGGERPTGDDENELCEAEHGGDAIGGSDPKNAIAMSFSSTLQQSVK